MTSHLIIVLAMCALLAIFLTFVVFKWNRLNRQRDWKTMTECRFTENNGHLSAAYFFDKGTTKTKGYVWKIDENGKYLSKTGFNGPYKTVWSRDQYEHQ